MRIVAVGEILWDVIAPSEYLGGAPLNFAAHARRLGHEVYLVSGVGADERGQRALEAIKRLVIARDFVQVVPGRPTGTAEVELDPSGKPMFRILRPAAYDFVRLDAQLRARIAALQPDWIYFGTLFHTSEKALASTLAVLDETLSARKIYDVNLRDGNWSLAAVERLAARADVIKLSDSEAEFLDASLGANGEEASIRHFCERWCDQYKCRTVCVTLGERGCAIYHERSFVEAPGFKVAVADTVGAGDAFAAALVHGLSQGWEMARCAAFANAVAALVASRPGAIPEWTVEEAWRLL
ncbi:MAG TPA: PfkB family carbohydrate kinase [Terriglobales bacterium]|nr:PfkB family carbohydrate kinase [Terriglobales bacterium]